MGLNAVQWAALKKAPIVWGKWNAHGKTIIALADRGLVQVKCVGRDRKFSEWRISKRGWQMYKCLNTNGPW